MVQEEKVDRVTSLETIQRVYEFLLRIKIPPLWRSLYSESAKAERKKQQKKEDTGRPSEYVYGHLVGKASLLPAP